MNVVFFLREYFKTDADQKCAIEKKGFQKMHFAITANLKKTISLVLPVAHKFYNFYCDVKHFCHLLCVIEGMK